MPRRLKLFFALATVTLILDQWTKLLARKHLGPQENGIVKTVISGYFDLRLSFNTGVAFGMFRDTAGGRYFLTAIGVLALAAIVYYVWRSKDDQTRLALGLGAIAGGAVGNVIDRVLAGKVTDFVVWKVGKHVWPAFNIADAALCIGVVLMIIDMFKTEAAERKSKSSSTS